MSIYSLLQSLGDNTMIHPSSKTYENCKQELEFSIFIFFFTRKLKWCVMIDETPYPTMQLTLLNSMVFGELMSWTRILLRTI